jgi:RNA polymerase-associated protein RTF1
MADIDDDLLALAGDASSDEEDDAPMNISRESSVSPDKSTGRGGAKKSGGQKSNRRQNDSEEEGEA